ncbi:hypothetical protein NED98_13165 [Sphingomonas sp. MMSM20]|uniref:hypothetical protein n=1 Tax=Sphingomonas lycopersici TaxID=2951807 RepID=UPI0022379D12|nr:hypothetical protein [Sphingomonas lycopersici]MCW6531196.1 hypothetical protein [Sphingomonas lycopersici]
MRSEQELAAIFVSLSTAMTIAVSAATPEPAPDQRSTLYMPPVWRRAFNLNQRDRLGKFNELVRALATAARTPEWMARMALDVVYIPGREADLDDVNNDAPALEMALMAMGLNPNHVAWASSTPN